MTLRILVVDDSAVMRSMVVKVLNMTGLPIGEIREARQAPPEYDGVAELWFDSLESANENARRPEAQAAAALLLEDERRFIELRRSEQGIDGRQQRMGLGQLLVKASALSRKPGCQAFQHSAQSDGV